MELVEFLEQENITPKMFALHANLSDPSIYKVLRGDKVGPNIARKIYNFTMGKVDLNIPYKSRTYYTKDLDKFRNRLRAPKKKKIYSESRMG